MRISGNSRKYNQMNLRLILFILFFSCVTSCRNSSPVENTRRPGQKEMEELNRFMIEKDRERIQNYIERKGLNMSETPTGLWYQIVKQGEGDFLKENSVVKMNYECSLLDGTKCYSSEETGPKEVILGRSTLESGLNEGLRFLKPGAEAIFIIPPFLAYGLPGDGKMIPPRAVVVYYINILQPE
jgi:FKBP-type peptidyl-prolyl cis-trans isomerase